MKHLILASALLCAASVATATTTPQPITNPVGETKSYLESGEGWYYFMGIVPARDFFKDLPTDIVYSADGKAYIYNIVPRFPTEAYVEGAVAENKITVTFPQLVKVEKRDGRIYEYYVDCLDFEAEGNDPNQGSYWPSTERSMVYEILEDGTVQLTGSSANHVVGITNEDGLWQGYADWDAVYKPNPYTVITPPEGLQVEEMEMIANYTGHTVGVAFDGDEVYIKGICEFVPDAWIKGSMNGSEITFENAQYLGNIPVFNRTGFMFGGMAHHDPKWIWGYSLSDNLVLTYDAQSHTFTTDQTIIINDNPNYLGYMYTYRFPEIHPVMKEHSEVPMTPAPISYMPYGTTGECTAVQFYLPNLSVDKCILPKDEIYWSLYIDGELYTFEPYLYEGLKRDMYEVPFNCDLDDIENQAESVIHTVYINGLRDFESIGFLSIHYVPGQSEPLYSEIGEFLNPAAVSEIGDDQDVKEKIYDLNGLPVTEPVKGRIYVVDRGTKTIKRIYR